MGGFFSWATGSTFSSNQIRGIQKIRKFFSAKAVHEEYLDQPVDDVKLIRVQSGVWLMH